MQEGFNYYNPIPNERESSLKKPLKVVFLTSIRDVGASDQNGQMITIPADETNQLRFMRHPEHQVYMEGLIEAILTTHREKLAGIIEVVGIITDDTETDTQRGNMGGFASSPDREGLWIFDKDLVNTRGEKMTDLTQNVPSIFRSLPLSSVEERAEGKADFEREVLRVFNEMGGDVLVSDHLMLCAKDLVTELRNKFLNIHPAITNSNHPFTNRGPTPTQESLNRANGLMTNTETGILEKIEPYHMTGATFHIINEVIDDGPLICDGQFTGVRSSDTPEELRYRNYQLSKIPVFINGMIHYVNHIYPLINAHSVERSTVLAR